VRLPRIIYFGLACGLVLGAICVLARAADTTYLASIAKWRQSYEAGLKSDDGWLTVSGLFFLHDGDNRFGADPLNDIVLPASDVPAEAGTFSFHDGKAVVHVNRGVKIMMNAKPVDSFELHADSPTERLRIGNLTLYLHASGARYAIRVKDKNSKLRTGFTGLHWFRVNESYRVTARYIPYSPPKQIEIQNVLGDFDKTSITGYVVFSLQGKEYRLDAEQDEPGILSFVFRDLTSGKETYPAARFLDIDEPKTAATDGGTMVVLDFNKAYNPPCAYNPYTTCPLPTPGNRLRVAIPAGEQIYKHDHAL
jgi:uncharacterized protein (DUF1684 family)